jgi:hypothetical protein
VITPDTAAATHTVRGASTPPRASRRQAAAKANEAVISIPLGFRTEATYRTIGVVAASTPSSDHPDPSQSSAIASSRKATDCRPDARRPNHKAAVEE